ncbi:Aste57867_12210 [Aphanomyces stellatus]|uniref:Aste57867_12210 protein n=1 Tax=Aphanomyces stellatus TaxID=120398 RepID=A0A485KV02_9STRA|nr:hypothetical protein As57867_012165 [Aphanomyces stellatus]VFT89064.1 Aste57867_12210 [Aphanomyces stellatus]
MNGSVEFDADNRLVLSPLSDGGDVDAFPNETQLSISFPVVDDIAPPVAQTSETNKQDADQKGNNGGTGMTTTLILDEPTQAPLNLHFSFNFDDTRGGETPVDGPVTSNELPKDTTGTVEVVVPADNNARAKLKQGKHGGFKTGDETVATERGGEEGQGDGAGAKVEGNKMTTTKGANMVETTTAEIKSTDSMLELHESESKQTEMASEETTETDEMDRTEESPTVEPNEQTKSEGKKYKSQQKSQVEHDIKKQVEMPHEEIDSPKIHGSDKAEKKSGNGKETAVVVAENTKHEAAHVADHTLPFQELKVTDASPLNEPANVRLDGTKVGQLIVDATTNSEEDSCGGRNMGQVGNRPTNQIQTNESPQTRTASLENDNAPMMENDVASRDNSQHAATANVATLTSTNAIEPTPSVANPSSAIVTTKSQLCTASQVDAGQKTMLFDTPPSTMIDEAVHEPNASCKNTIPREAPEPSTQDAPLTVDPTVTCSSKQPEVTKVDTVITVPLAANVAVAALAPPTTKVEYTVESVFSVKWEDDVCATKPSKTSSLVQSKLSTQSPNVSQHTPRGQPSEARKATTKKVQPHPLAKAKSSHGASHMASTAGAGTNHHAIEMQMARDASAVELAKLRAQLQCAVGERDALQSRWDRAMIEVADTTTQMHTFQTQVATAVAERDVFATQCKSLAAALATAEKTLDEYRQKTTSGQVELHQVKVLHSLPFDDAYQPMQAKCSVVEGKLEALMRDKADAVVKLDAAKQGMARLHHQIEKHKEKTHKLELEVAHVRTKHIDDVAKWQKKAEHLGLEAAVAVERTRKQLVDEHATKVKSIHAHVAKQVREADDTNAIVARRNQTLEAKLQAARDQIVMLENQLRPLAGLTKRVKSLEGVQEANKQLHHELHQLHRQMHKEQLEQARETSRRKKMTSKMREIVVGGSPLPPSPLYLNQASLHHRDKEENDEAYQRQVARLEERLATESAHVASLRQLHLQELELQASSFQRRIDELQGHANTSR